MVITWDERKRLSNLDKHGLDFADLTLEFFETARLGSAKRERYLAVGELDGDTAIVVIFALLGTEAISVISMRRANRRERSDAPQAS